MKTVGRVPSEKLLRLHDNECDLYISESVLEWCEES